MMDVQQRNEFAQQGFINLGKLLNDEEVDYFDKIFCADRNNFPYFWHPYGHHQEANYDALLTTPGFDGLVRHPKIYPFIEDLMGGPLCFGEIGLRTMGSYAGAFHQGWHRDKPHWLDHPLRMDYIQLMVYLADVDSSTHCFSISPEAIREPVIEDNDEQLKRGGIHDLHGPAGTCALFNVAVLHTATTRATKAERRTVQIYYGHRDRAPLANDSGIPAKFWRDSTDADTRAFYGVLNERTKIYMDAFGPSESSL
ncbi:MAG: phytanoyl-CoA dioxygenase family protein [Candidatus Latescibacterota bacterium]|nr:phytanoyl-CoA dioxygenase family protein [Candidatus Latescibacterota bacterium]